MFVYFLSYKPENEIKNDLISYKLPSILYLHVQLNILNNYYKYYE